MQLIDLIGQYAVLIIRCCRPEGLVHVFLQHPFATENQINFDNQNKRIEPRTFFGEPGKDYSNIQYALP